MEERSRLTKYICLAILGLAICSCSLAGRELSAAQEVERERKLVSLLEEFTSESRLKLLNENRARALLELARELSPRDPRVLDALGCLEWRVGNYRTAEYFFKTALSQNPNYDRAYAHLALVAERDGNTQAAAQLLKTAVYLNPLNYRSRNNLAVLMLEAGDGKRAYGELLKARQSAEEVEWVLEGNLATVTGTGG